MNILFLAPHPFYQPRGTPIAEKGMIEVLTRMGHRVDVATFHEGEDPGVPGCTLHRIPRLPGVSGVRPGFSWKKLVCDVFLLFKSYRLIRHGHYDVIHAAEEGAFIAAVLGRLHGIPFVYDMDSSLAQQMAEKFPFLSRFAGVLAACERFLIRRSLGVVAVCKALEQVVLEYEPAKLVARVEDVSLLPDETAPQAQRREELVVTGGLTVMYVGNLEEYQGIDLLLEAFSLASREVPEVQLCIVGGDDRSIAYYVSQARRLGVASKVHFLGPRPITQLRELFQRSDVLVSPRIRGKNTPMKVYSYLDSGKAILATRLPTHTQVLDDTVSVLVRPTASEMGAGMVRMLRDERFREQLAAAAKRLAVQEYTPAAQHLKIERFYGKVERMIFDASAKMAGARSEREFSQAGAQPQVPTEEVA